MMLLAGTVPTKDLPLTFGKAKLEGQYLIVNDCYIPCTQGTGAMISAALAAADYLNLEPPSVLIAGDIGRGEGSRQIYKYLINEIARLFQNKSAFSPNVLALHYCLPNMGLMKKLCESVKKCAEKPVMIADAAAMYAAKAAGLASEFDIFTPDSAETSFLADHEAAHPAYISKHLFNANAAAIPELAAAAYKYKNAARLLLVKGETDYIVSRGEIMETITEPNIPELEAIGGTGDTITGLTAAFVYAGLELHEAAVIAAKTNRMAGKFALPTPATRVWQIIEQFPAVFKEYLCKWSGVCLSDGERLTALP